MELRYCDNCGEILKAEEGGTLLEAGGYLCAKCSAKRQGEDGGSPQAPEQASNTELQNEAGQKETGSQPPKEGGRKAASQGPRVPTEISLSSLLGTAELDLYSAETIARKQKETSVRSGKTKIRLLDPDSATATTTASGGPDRQDDTGAVSDQGQVGSAVQVQGSGSAKFTFLCPACRAALAVKPIQRPSRLRCPRCRSRIGIEPGKPPRLLESGTQVVRKTPGGATRYLDILNAPLLPHNPNTPAGTQGTGGFLYEEEREQQGSPEGTAGDQVGSETSGSKCPSAGPGGATATARGTSPVTGTHPGRRFKGIQREARRRKGRSTTSAAKAAFLAAVLAAPFCVWTVLLALSGNPVVKAYLSAFGDIVRQALENLMGP